MKKIYRKKRRTRKIILQILYGFYFSDLLSINFEGTVIDKINKNKTDYSYLNFLIFGILKKIKILDLMTDFNFKNYKYFSVIDKLIIKIALFDIFFNKKISLKVVINESIELAKLFSSKNSYIYINKLLNDVVKGYMLNKSNLL